MNFTQYSSLNRMLIYSQQPEAKYVASYRKWNELGFHVIKKGGIKVLCPLLKKGFIDENGSWKSVKKATDDEKTKIDSGVLAKKDFVYDYAPKTVFDISNTNATEEDLVKLQQKTDKTEYPVDAEDVLKSLEDYFTPSFSSVIGNTYERIYEIVHDFVIELVDKEAVFDEECSKIIIEAITFATLNQMHINTSLFEFKALNSLNYTSDYESLVKLNKYIINGTEYTVNELQKAFI